MLIIHSHDRYRDFLQFDPATGASRHLFLDDVPKLEEKSCGHFAQINGHLMMLFRDDESLHLRIDRQDYVITDTTRVALERGRVNVLSIYQGENLVDKFSYEPYHPDLVDHWRIYWTPFITKEDWDFGLYVFNVLNDTGRRNRIYQR